MSSFMYGAARAGGADTASVKVAVRVRPLSAKERNEGDRVVVRCQDGCVLLTHPSAPPSGPLEGWTRRFDYDLAYDERSTQAKLYNDLGGFILENAFQGYNTSIFSYGQTGAGKTYTMMGDQRRQGIIPRTCKALFDRVRTLQHGGATGLCTVEVSYLEIYNERVRDLFKPRDRRRSAGLRVREHPKKGVYVEGLSVLAVRDYNEVERLLTAGNFARTVAATDMNENSSRSHAVFQIVFRRKESATASARESKMSLVDLAGSERADRTGTLGARLKEAANINKSLSTLGDVIKALSDRDRDRAGKKTRRGRKKTFVPYRNSVLTWLLKESLGGNSKTAMIAAISPASTSYDESLTTLQYVARAKSIVNRVKVNEDSDVALVHELKREIAALKAELVAERSRAGSDLTRIEAEMGERERMLGDIERPWDERVAATRRLEQEHEAALRSLGVSVAAQSSGTVAGPVVERRPHLVNLNQDPLFSETIICPFEPGMNRIGRPESAVEQDIKLSGAKILPEHCVVEVNAAGSAVTLFPAPHAQTFLNGFDVTDTLEPTPLCHGDRLVLGDNHYFRFQLPAAAVASRVMHDCNAEPMESEADWQYARQEMLLRAQSDSVILELSTELDEAPSGLAESAPKHETSHAPSPEIVRQEELLEAQLAHERSMVRLRRRSALTEEEPNPPGAATPPQEWLDLNKHLEEEQRRIEEERLRYEQQQAKQRMRHEREESRKLRRLAKQLEESHAAAEAKSLLARKAEAKATRVQEALRASRALERKSASALAAAKKVAKAQAEKLSTTKLALEAEEGKNARSRQQHDQIREELTKESCALASVRSDLSEMRKTVAVLEQKLVAMTSTLQQERNAAKEAAKLAETKLTACTRQAVHAAAESKATERELKELKTSSAEELSDAHARISAAEKAAADAVQAREEGQRSHEAKIAACTKEQLAAAADAQSKLDEKTTALAAAEEALKAEAAATATLKRRAAAMAKKYKRKLASLELQAAELQRALAVEKEAHTMSRAQFSSELAKRAKEADVAQGISGSESFAALLRCLQTHIGRDSPDPPVTRIREKPSAVVAWVEKAFTSMRRRQQNERNGMEKRMAELTQSMRESAAVIKDAVGREEGLNMSLKVQSRKLQLALRESEKEKQRVAEKWEAAEAALACERARAATVEKKQREALREQVQELEHVSAARKHLLIELQEMRRAKMRQPLATLN